MVLTIFFGLDLTAVKFSASTAFHALELGFRTILIEDCSRGIRSLSLSLLLSFHIINIHCLFADLSLSLQFVDRDENIKTTFERVRSEFGCVVKSNEVFLPFFTLDK